MKKYYVCKDNMFDSLDEVREKVRGEMVEVGKEKDIKLLIEALVFYGNSSRYLHNNWDKNYGRYESQVDKDNGQKAREALKQWEA